MFTRLLLFAFAAFISAPDLALSQPDKKCEPRSLLLRRPLLQGSSIWSMDLVTIDSTCKAHLVVDLRNRSAFSADVHHGGRRFRTGKGSFSGHWIAAVPSEGMGLSMIADPDLERRLKRRSAHTRQRELWLAPLDQEGYQINYPYSEQDVVDFYPRHFTFTGKSVTIWNPEFPGEVRSFSYVTMSGARRAAITAIVTVATTKIRLVGWVESKNRKAAEAQMIQYLEGLDLKELDTAETHRAISCARDTVPSASC